MIDMNKRILLLAYGGSTHTVKWAKSLANQGYKIHIFSLADFSESLYADYPEIEFSHSRISSNVSLTGSAFQKIFYLKTYFSLMRCLKIFKPDIIHAHFASSYGFLGSLTFFRPFFVSVWGSDIFEFPRKTFLHKLILQFTLWRADRIFSTSKIMAIETSKYTKKIAQVIPFGVDTELFSPEGKKDHLILTIGTVKSLEAKYGVHTLLNAFAKVIAIRPSIKMKLLIVGDGTQLNNLKILAQDLKIEHLTEFTGWLQLANIPSVH